MSAISASKDFFNSMITSLREIASPPSCPISCQIYERFIQTNGQELSFQLPEWGHNKL